MPSSGFQTCALDRKSTRLNSSHTIISYAVFCLKKHSTKGLPVRVQTERRPSAPPPSPSPSDGRRLLVFGAAGRRAAEVPRGGDGGLVVVVPARERPVADAGEGVALDGH